MLADSTPTKVCTKCRRALPLDRFYVLRRAPDGLTWECKGCARARGRASRPLCACGAPRYGKGDKCGACLIAPLDRYAVDAASGCWLWQGAINSDGYGSITSGMRSLSAHRFFYEHHIGPIADGLQLDHVKARGCVHRHCVNPAHLEPVTNAENSRRGRCAKLTWDDVRAMRCSSESPSALAKRYGLARSYVSKILGHRAWQEPGQGPVSRDRTKLTRADVDRIRALWDAGERSQSSLAREYGLSSRHVSGIVRRLSWK